MHAQDGGTALQRQHMQGGRAVEGGGGVATHQAEHHRLARHTHQQGQAHHLEAVELGEQSVVLLQGLAEAEAWVEYDVLDTEVTQLLHLL